MLTLNHNKSKSLSSLKIYSNYSYIYISLIFFFLSLAGIPPLLNFSGKLMLLSYITIKFKAAYVVAITLLNLFSMYFYIQNLRFCVSKPTKTFFNYKTYYTYINTNFILNLNLINYINVLNLFYINVILNFFYQIIIYVYI